MTVPVRSVSSAPIKLGGGTTYTATIFGANGNVGNFVCGYLGPLGTRMVVPFRDDGYNIRDAKVTGEVGQVAPIKYSMFDEDSIRKCVEQSDIVINCIGANYETMHYNLHDANFKTALRLAKISKNAGVKRFVHLSVAGAAENAGSAFQQIKFQSEEAVKTYFPQATIIRPCFTYNLDNNYIHWLANLARSIHPLRFIPDSNAQIQPTFSRDIAMAIAQIVANPQIDGQTWTLGGDKVMTRGQLYEHIYKMIEPFHERVPRHLTTDETEKIYRVYETLSVPDLFRFPLAPNSVLPTASSDFYGQDVTVKNSATTKGFAELGITPTPFNNIMVKLLREYIHSDAAVLNTTITKKFPSIN